MQHLDQRSSKLALYLMQTLCWLGCLGAGQSAIKVVYQHADSFPDLGVLEEARENIFLVGESNIDLSNTITLFQLELEASVESSVCVFCGKTEQQTSSHWAASHL